LSYARVPDSLKQALAVHAHERGLSLTAAAVALLERGLEDLTHGYRQGRAEPQWSPDGRSIVFARASRYQRDIYVMDGYWRQRPEPHEHSSADLGARTSLVASSEVATSLAQTTNPQACIPQFSEFVSLVRSQVRPLWHRMNTRLATTQRPPCPRLVHAPTRKSYTPPARPGSVVPVPGGVDVFGR